MSFITETKNICENIGCEYIADVSMSGYTSFKIGGNAAIMVFPDTEDKLAAIIEYCSNNSVKKLLLGKGSNMLVSDEGFAGIVINTCKLDKIELIDETTVYCQSGAALIKLCRFALDNGLTGLEFAYGIPGTAGGAAYMNAGAYGGEMKDVLVKCEHISPDAQKGSFEADKLDLSYRHSVYSKKDYVITSLVLKLKKGNKTEIKAKMDELMAKRVDKQPLDYPSAGSTFKRPEGYFAGALIEQCGLKGFSIGGAQVSEKHAGFVINKGGATASDVMNLIEHCKKVILNETGVTLEPEVEIIK